jgi:hypothetical protein
MIVNTDGLSGANSSDLVLDPSHHTVILNSTDPLASISLGIITHSLAAQGYIDAHAYTDVHLLPEIAASLSADFAISFPSDVSLNVPAADVRTTPTDANASITVEGNAAGAQFTTTGSVELIALALNGTTHQYDFDFQGDAGILDFEFAAPNGTSDTSLAWAADSLTLHTASNIAVPYMFS